MAKKEDLKDALRLKTPAGKIPCWELEFHLWDKASGQPFYLGRVFEALTEKEKERAIETNADIMAGVAEELGFAGVTCPGSYWEVAPGEPAFFWLPGDWPYRQARALASRSRDRLMLLGVAPAVMSIPAAQDYVDFSYLLFDNPEEVDRRARDLFDRGLERARKWIDAGAEAIITASDLADNHGPFFNPEQMDRYVLPSLRKFAEKMKEAGVFSIIHTDGDMVPLLEGVVRSGVNAMQAVDPTAGMDLAETKRRVNGRLCLCGNVDCGLLMTGTPEKVYEAAKACLTAGAPGGGFVFGASNAVVNQTPIENYRAMMEAWREF